jgi:hypothetical protein
MSDAQIQFTFRGPAQWERELDDLIPHIAASPYAAALVGKVTRAAVTRVVIAEGLRVVQARVAAEAAATVPVSAPIALAPREATRAAPVEYEHDETASKWREPPTMGQG